MYYLSIYDILSTIVAAREANIILQESPSLYSQFIEVIRLLASPPDQQIGAFPSQTRVTDEIGIIFDESYRRKESLIEERLLDTSAVELLEEINSLFEQISKQQELWSNKSLDSADEWISIRAKALNLLTILNLDMNKPDLHWLHFVK